MHGKAMNKMGPPWIVGELGDWKFDTNPGLKDGVDFVWTNIGLERSMSRSQLLASKPLHLVLKSKDMIGIASDVGFAEVGVRDLANAHGKDVVLTLKISDSRRRNIGMLEMTAAFVADPMSQLEVGSPQKGPPSGVASTHSGAPKVKGQPDEGFIHFMHVQAFNLKLLATMGLDLDVSVGEKWRKVLPNAIHVDAETISWSQPIQSDKMSLVQLTERGMVFTLMSTDKTGKQQVVAATSKISCNEMIGKVNAWTELRCPLSKDGREVGNLVIMSKCVVSNASVGSPTVRFANNVRGGSLTVQGQTSMKAGESAKAPSSQSQPGLQSGTSGGRASTDNLEDLERKIKARIDKVGNGDKSPHSDVTCRARAS